MSQLTLQFSRYSCCSHVCNWFFCLLHNKHPTTAFTVLLLYLSHFCVLRFSSRALYNGFSLLFIYLLFLSELIEKYIFYILPPPLFRMNNNFNVCNCEVIDERHKCGNWPRFVMSFSLIFFLPSLEMFCCQLAFCLIIRLTTGASLLVGI